MPSSEELVNEVRKSGFLLEWRTAQVFQENGYLVNQNVLIESNLNRNEVNGHFVELDIFAYEERAAGPRNAFLIECKGSGADDRLVLVSSADKQKTFPGIYFEKNKVRLDGEQRIFLDNCSENHPKYSHTGDFFNKNSNGSGYKKASKQDQMNNLYKGVAQLYYSIDGIFSLPKRSQSLKIYPTIVTNAEIHIVNPHLFGLGRKLVTSQVPWAGYQNPMFYHEVLGTIGYHDWEYSDDVEAKYYSERKQIPYIWIVGIEYLKDFILSGSLGYDTTLRAMEQRT